MGVTPDHRQAAITKCLQTDGIDQLVGERRLRCSHASRRAEPATPATPRYIAIAALVRDRIATEQLGPHTLLPSERELAEQHGVSRMTARQALSLLESEGVVYRKPPRGTFVAEPRVRFHIGSFSEEVSRLGRRPAARLLWAEHQHPTPAVRMALGLDEGAMVNVFHRLRTVDDVPFALETTFLPADLTPGILDERRGRFAVGGAAEPLRHRPGTVDARCWNRSSSTMRPARSSACGPVRRAPCSPAAPRTPPAGVWNTPATSIAPTGRRSRFPNCSARIGCRRSEPSVPLP